MKIKTIVEQEVTPPVYLDYDGEVDCIKSTDDMLSVNPGKLITRAEYISRLVKENTGQPLTAQDLDDLRALIEPKETFKVGDQVILEKFDICVSVSWPVGGRNGVAVLDKRDYIGTIAIIDQVRDSGCYGVVFHDRKTALWHTSGMKLWTPRPPKVGDLVRTDRFEEDTNGLHFNLSMEKFIGKIGIIEGLGCTKGNYSVFEWEWPASALTIIKPAP